MEQGYILIPMDAFYESIKFPDPHQSSSINTGSVPSFSLVFPHSITNSKDRGSQVSQEGKLLLDTFVQQVEEVFKKLPKPLEWRSFYRHDLNLIVDTAQEVRKVSIQHKLNKSQTWALEKLHRVSKSQFKAFIQESPEPRTKEQGSDGPSPSKERGEGSSLRLTHV